jgi:hypothetical protein
MKLWQKPIAQVMGRALLFTLCDEIMTFEVQALPWQRTAEKVDEDICKRLKVIPPSVLHA